jgi:exosortase
MAQTAPAIPMAKKISKQAWWILTLGPLVLYVYGPTLLGLVRQWWHDPNFGHGSLVPLFSAFVVWHRRARLALLPAKPSWAGLAVVIFALVMLVAGVLGAELFLARSSFVFLLAGLVILFGGWNYFREVLFPWGCLFLMVPIPVIVFSQITLPLQLLASKLASQTLAFLGVPVLREGNIIILTGMSLEVAEACSGIRSLMSLVTLAVIYGYFSEPRLVVRGLLALAAIPIAVAANALRIVGTGLLVEYGNQELAEGFFHLFSGWLIFVISLVLLWALHKAIRAVMKKYPVC